MTRLTLLFAVAGQVSLAANAASAQNNPMDSIRRLPGYRATRDTVPLLSPKKLALLPVMRRAHWTSYIERSRKRYSLDTAAMRAELVAAGKTAMARAPYASGFEITRDMTPAWFATDSAQGIARNILSYQAPNGGWSKHVDVIARPRLPGESFFSESEEWQWIATIDNGSTTSHMRFLALADSARATPAYRAAFLRGMRYILDAQFPNGCWPQIWPLEGSYHDAATFNDDATLNATQLLHDISDGKFSFVPLSARNEAKKAVSASIECILGAQVKVGGKLTAWGQQHDPLTLAPTSARSYEPTSLTAQESANLMRFLMKSKKPSLEIVEAVHAAADWLAPNAIYDYRYGADQVFEKSPGAGPVWARMYEIGTNRPVFSDRNGIKLYDWNQLMDRRKGYGWFTYSPIEALARYKKWALLHPRQK